LNLITQISVCSHYRFQKLSETLIIFLLRPGDTLLNCLEQRSAVIFTRGARRLKLIGILSNLRSIWPKDSCSGRSFLVQLLLHSSPPFDLLFHGNHLPRLRSFLCIIHSGLLTSSAKFTSNGVFQWCRELQSRSSGLQHEKMSSALFVLCNILSE